MHLLPFLSFEKSSLALYRRSYSLTQSDVKTFNELSSQNRLFLSDCACLVLAGCPNPKSDFSSNNNSISFPISISHFNSQRCFLQYYRNEPICRLSRMFLLRRTFLNSSCIYPYGFHDVRSNSKQNQIRILIKICILFLISLSVFIVILKDEFSSKHMGNPIT